MSSFTSADLSGALSDETGTGAAVFASNPTLVNPTIGTVGSAVEAIIRNSQAAGATSIVKSTTTEVTYTVANVTAGATAIVSFDAQLTAGIYVAYTRTLAGQVIVGYGNANNTNNTLAGVNIKIVVIQ